MKVFFDTNIWRGKSRKSSAIKSIQRLARSKKVSMLLPYIVEHEFKTQTIDAGTKEFVRHLDSLQEKIDSTEGRLLKLLKSQKSFTEKNYQRALNDIGKATDLYMKKFNLERIELSLEQTVSSFQAYFKGDLPFSSVKFRKDIPDSFIFQSIIEYSSNHPVERFYLVIRDEGLKTSLDKLNNPQFCTFKTVDELIRHTDFQSIFANEFVNKNINAIKKSLSAKRNLIKLTEAIEGQVYDKVSFKDFRTSIDYADNNEAIVNSVNDLDMSTIQFDFNEITDYGGGEVVLPFSVDAEVLANYFIYKSDLWAMDGAPSYSDHNDHYVEAEDYFEVRLDGLLTIDIDAPSNNQSKFKVNMINYSSCEIDSDVELSEI